VILATMRLNVRSEKRRELLQTVLSLLGPIRNDQSAKTCRFYLDMENENSFVLLEEWETEKDLDRHLRSEEFRVLLGAANLLCEAPAIQFKVYSSTDPTTVDFENTKSKDRPEQQTRTNLKG